jgi:two-component system LytT family response regulator
MPPSPDRRMRVLIVDDEPLARFALSDRLAKRPDVELVGECATGKEAITAIRRRSPQVVFLDIQMPDMSGFEVLRSVPHREAPLVIFVTAYDRYAVKAFEIHALDYLLKPLVDDRFAEALERARAQISTPTIPKLDQRLLELLENGTAGMGKRRYEEHFSVRSGQRIAIVPVADVDWIEASGDYVSLHTGKKCHLMRVTMNRIETKLDPARFIRIHRSAIVQANRISELVSLDNREFIVRLADGTELSASRTYCDRLQRWL